MQCFGIRINNCSLFLILSLHKWFTAMSLQLNVCMKSQFSQSNLLSIKKLSDCNANWQKDSWQSRGAGGGGAARATNIHYEDTHWRMQPPGISSLFPKPESCDSEKHTLTVWMGSHVCGEAWAICSFTFRNGGQWRRHVHSKKGGWKKERKRTW